MMQQRGSNSDNKVYLYAEFIDKDDFKVYNPYGWRFVVANVALFFGIVCSLIDWLFFSSPQQLWWILGAVIIYLMLGVWEAVARAQRGADR